MILLIQDLITHAKDGLLTINNVTISGVFMFFIGYLIHENRSLKAMIKDKDAEIKEAVRTQIEILNKNGNNADQIKEYFISMAEQIKALLETTRKSG